MLDLSPTKLLLVLIVAVVVVGPARLPQAARGLARGWRRIRGLHAEIERELRQGVPGLPPALDLVRTARSPVSLLNRLADAVPAQAGTPEAEAADAPGEDHPAPTASLGGGHPAAPWPAPVATGAARDDPSMN